MSRLSRICKSRRAWKDKAVYRATQLRRQRGKSARSRKKEDSRHRELEERISFLECENAALKSTSESCPPAVVGDDALDRRRTACVMMPIEGTVSFRAFPRIWGVLQRLGWVQIEMPHSTSVIHWTLRATRPSSRSRPRTGLDCRHRLSIDIGTRKALVVLRVPLAALQKNKTPSGSTTASASA